MTDKIKVLVVDDEKQFLDSMAERLQMRDFDITKAYEGKTAVELARAKKFDLALLDLKMPGLNGQQVLEILKQEHKFIEVIILTGHGSLESAVECTKLGAFGYLPKPYEFDKLIQTLKDAYEERLKKKFQEDDKKMEQLMKIAMGNSPLAILKELRQMDNDEK